MMKNLFMFCCLLMSGISQSQPYKIIRHEFTCFFKNSNPNNNYYSKIYTVRIDSVRYETSDTIYYNMRNMKRYNNSSDIYTNLYDYFSGKHIVETQNNNVFFVRSNQDTIWLKQNAFVGESWILYQDLINGYIIEAKVDSIVSKQLINNSLTDSVKVISLKKISLLGTLMSSSINNKQIWISKNYGITRLILFNEIDFNSEVYPYDEYDLNGIEQLDLGYYDVKAKDIFNYEVGDIFHIYQVNADIIVPYNYITKKCIEVIEKQEISTGYVYNYRVKENYYNNGTTSTSDYFIQDNINLDYYSFLNALPCEVTVSSTGLSIPLSFASLANHFGKCWQKTFHISDTSNSFFYQVSGFPMPNAEKAYSGLGYDYYYFTYIGIVKINDLVYFQKGNEIYGSPYNCDSLINLNLIDNKYNGTLLLEISPNPSIGLFHLKFTILENQNISLEISSITGIPVFFNYIPKFSGTYDEIIDISCYPKGMYHLKIKTDKEVFVYKIFTQ